MAQLLSRKDRYKLFLESDWWIDFSLKFRTSKNWTCEDCGEKTRDCHSHHIFYPDDWYQTKVEHLRCLCAECHRLAHGKGRIQARAHRPKRKKAKKERTKLDPKVLPISNPAHLNWKDLNIARANKLISRDQFEKRREELRALGLAPQKFRPPPRKPPEPKVWTGPKITKETKPEIKEKFFRLKYSIRVNGCSNPYTKATRDGNFLIMPNGNRVFKPL